MKRRLYCLTSMMFGFIILSGCGRLRFDYLDESPTVSVDAAGNPTCALWGPFSTPVLVSELSSAAIDWAPSISRDGLRMTFSSNRASNHDLYFAQRTSTSLPWGAPTMIAGLGSPTDEEDNPSLSSDGLEMYYSKNGLDNLALTGRCTSCDARVAARRLQPTSQFLIRR
jgi:hypothetical protein